MLTQYPAPYSTCASSTDGQTVLGSNPWYYGKSNYTEEACYRSCLQQLIFTKCGCSDPTLAPVPNSNFCGDPTTSTLTACECTRIAPLNTHVHSGLRARCTERLDVVTSRHMYVVCAAVQVSDGPRHAKHAYMCSKTLYAVTTSQSQYPAKRYFVSVVCVI
jgi:hypothetical protein